MSRYTSSSGAQDSLQILYDQLIKLNDQIRREGNVWEIAGLIAQMEHQLHYLALDLPNTVRQRACATLTHDANGNLKPEFRTYLIPKVPDVHG